MLKLIAIGNIGSELEEKTLDGGRLLVKFRLGARHRSGKESKTEWINVAVFGKLAEICKQYLHKGSKIYVEGDPTARGYKNKMEEIVGSLDLVADVVEFCDKKGEDGEPVVTVTDTSDIPF